jgi:hypothetical protein
MPLLHDPRALYSERLGMTFILEIDTHVRMGDKASKCAICGSDLGEFTYQPMPQWNISGLICSQCYDKKLTEHYIAPDRRDITKK